MPLIGTGGLGSRVWSGPAITVTGIDVPSRRRRAQRRLAARAREDQPARASRAGRGGGAGGARRATCARVRPFGIALEVHAGRDRQRLRRRRPPARPTRPRARRWSTAWGIAPVSAAGGGSIPLVNALAGGRARRRDPAGRAPRTATRTSTHPTSACCSTSSSAPWRRGRLLRRVRRSAGDGRHGGLPTPAAPSTRGMQRMLDGIERLGQQDARPGDPVPLALRRRDRALAGARLARRQGDLRGRRAAAGAGGGDLLRRLHGPRLRRAERARAGRRLRGAGPRRPRSRAC